MCFHHDCSTLWVKVCVVLPQENVKFSLLFLRVIFRHKIIFQLLPLNKKMLRSWKMESNFVIKVHTCNEVWADYQTSLRITQVFSTPPKTTACLMKLWQGGGTLQPIIKTVKYIYLWTMNIHKGIHNKITNHGMSNYYTRCFYQPRSGRS